MIHFWTGWTWIWCLVFRVYCIFLSLSLSLSFVPTHFTTSRKERRNKYYCAPERLSDFEINNFHFKHSIRLKFGVNDLYSQIQFEKSLFIAFKNRITWNVTIKFQMWKEKGSKRRAKKHGFKIRTKHAHHPYKRPMPDLIQLSILIFHKNGSRTKHRIELKRERERKKSVDAMRWRWMFGHCHL